MILDSQTKQVRLALVQYMNLLVRILYDFALYGFLAVV